MIRFLRAHPILSFVLALFLGFIPLQFITPIERLHFSPFDLLYVGIAVAFLFIQGPKKWWRTCLATFLVTQASFVVLYYLLHDGTLNLVSFFLVLLPALLWGLFELFRWSLFHIKLAESRQALFLSALSWGLFAAAYPPLPLGPAGFALLAPWIIVLMRANMGQALFATFWSGVLFHSLSYFWIFNVAKVGPAPAVIGGLFLLISYFSMFYVVAAWAFVRLRELRVGKISLVWLFPFVWAGIEVIRSYGQISFPWGHLGYIFGNHVEVVQGLAWIGVYGYTIALLFSNMIFAIAIEKRNYKLAAAPVFILMAFWIHGSISIRAADLARTQMSNVPSMNIALVQPAISQTKKWSKAYYDSVMNKTWSVLDTLHNENLDLVVLPETAIPDFISLRRREVAKFRHFSQEKQVNLFVGALNFDRNGPPPRNYRFFNSGFLFEGNAPPTEFRKTRLVPFSEYLPFNGLLPVLNYVDLGEGDFSAGDTLPMYGSALWTPNICYESIYPDVMRRMVRNGTRLVVNITNDGWFGKTTAPGQHANIIRYRAIEAGLPIARCANSGISIFYDAQGRSYEKTGLFDVRIVYHRLQVRTTTTLYTHIGDYIEDALALFFTATALFLIALRKRPR